MLTVVLHNIRSTYNVGAILRTCEGLGVRRVILSGYTPRVHDQTLLPHLRDKLDHEIRKTALGAEDMLDIYAPHDIFEELTRLHADGWQILGLENHLEAGKFYDASSCVSGQIPASAKPLYHLGDPSLHSALRSDLVLLLGEEVHGIDYSLYDIIDLFIEIPMQGQKESFNVSVATAIALWELTRYLCLH